MWCRWNGRPPAALRPDQGFFRIRAFNGEALGIVACGESANAAGVFDGPIGELGIEPCRTGGASARPLPRHTSILIDSGAVFERLSRGHHAHICDWPVERQARTRPRVLLPS